MPDKQTQSSPSAESTQPSSGLARAFGVAVRGLLAVVLGVVVGYVVYMELVYPIALINERLDNVSNQTYGVEYLTQRYFDESSALRTVNERLDEQMKTLGEVQADLQALQAAQADTSTTAEQINEIRTGLAGVLTLEKQTTDRLDALERAAGTPDPKLAEMSRQLEILRLMSVVSQVRLFVVQGDYGQAAAALDSAQVIAKSLTEVDPADSQMQDVQSRLDMARQELQSRPLIAAGDLDIAWQFLVELSAGP